MSNKYLIIITAFTLFSCKDNNNGIDVTIYGELFQIMHEGRRIGEISLLDAVTENFTYGLGAMEGLNGEVVIMDNKILINTAEPNEIPVSISEITSEDRALLLATATVENWQTVRIFDSATSSNIDEIIKNKAYKMGINTNMPFLFMIDGDFELLNWHIISSPGIGGNHNDHLSSAWTRSDKNLDGKILGFYSENHQAIFTHHTTYTHMHVIYEVDQLSGHVDDLILKSHWTLSLPEINSLN